MGREIDERVVQMKFENGQFEKGIATSIRSMEELKKGMDFDDAVKGFNKLDETAKGFKLTGLASGVDAVRVKFDLLQITAFNVLNRISNKAIDTGERMVKSLSIEQVSEGWGKFAEKTGAVQTIMAATSKQFTDTSVQMAYVNEQLDKLNWFTDETSYNFVDMVNNIGKFTSNNIALDESVTAMQGIANWAAISGANANEASRAMYNMSQAMSAGAMKLQDWISIENANMGTAAFKEMAIQMALTAGTLKKNGDTIVTANKGIEVSVEKFRDTLSEGWLNKEVLMNTLNEYGQATNKLNKWINELSESTEDHADLLTSDLVGAIDDYQAGVKTADEISKDWGISLKKTEEILNDFSSETDKFGLKAFKAAQEAKTFEDAINSVKDAVSTGWMKSFEYIFGDYLEAKEFWTDIANELYDLFAASSSARNDLLYDWKQLGGRNYLVDAIHGIILSITSLKQAVSLAFADAFGVLDGQKLFDMTVALHSFVVALIPSAETMNKFARIVRGAASAVDILKTVLFGGIGKAFKLLGVLSSGLNIDLLEFLATIGDNIYAFRNWVHESTILNDAADRLIDNVVTLKENFRALVDQFNALPIIQELRAAFTSFGTTLATDAGKVVEELRENFKRFFEYLKTVEIDFSLDGFLTVWKKFVEIVIGDTTTLKKIGTDTSNFFTKMFKLLGSNLGFLERPFQIAVELIKHLLDELHIMISGIKAVDIAIIAFSASIFITLSKISKAVGSVVGLFTNFTDVFSSFGEASKKWGTAKIIKSVGLALLAFAVALRLIADVPAERIWETVAVVGALGTMVVGFTAAIMGLDVAFKKFKVSPKTIVALGAVGLSILAIAHAMKDIVEAQKLAGGNLAAPIVSLASLIAAVAAAIAVITKLSPNINGMLASIAGLGLAVSLVINAVTQLAQLDDPTLSRGVAGLTAIMFSIAGAVGIMALLGGKQRGIDKAMGTLIGFGIAVRIIVSAVKSLAKVNPEDAIIAIIGLGTLMTEMGIAVGLMQRIGGGAIKAGGTLLALSVALNLLIPAIKGLSTIDDDQLDKAKNVITRLGAIFVAAILATSLGGNDAHKAGLMLIEMAAAITLLVVAVRAFGIMDVETLKRGVTAVSVLGLVFSTAIAASKDTGKAKVSIIAMTAALGVLMYSVYELSKLDTKSLIASAGSISLVILAFGGAIRLLKKLDINAKTIVAIGLMSTVADMFSYVLVRMTEGLQDPTKAIAAAAALGVFMTALAGSMTILSHSKGAVDNKTIKQVVIFGVIAAAIGGVILAITAIPTTDAKKAAIVLVALDALLPVMTACYYQLTKIDMAPNKSTINKFIKFAAIIGGIGAVIFGLTAIPTTDAKKAAIVLVALDALLPVMMACYFALSKIRKSPPKTVMDSFTDFAIIVGALGAVLTYLTRIETDNINNAITVVKAIDLLIPVMTACFAGLSLVKGSVSAGQLGMFAAFTVVASAMTGLIAWLADITGIDFEAGMKAAIMIDTLIPVLVACMGGLALIGMIPVSAPAILAMAVVMDAVGILVTALVAVVGMVPTDLLETAATNGALIGSAIGGFLGGVVGGLVGGAITGVASALPYLGEQLTKFSENAQGFFDSLEGIGDDTPAKAALLAGAIVALAGADFILAVETLAGGVINKISEFLGIDTDFAGKMSDLGEGIAAFANEIGSVNPEQVKTAAEAARILTAVEAGIPAKDGALQTFFGEQDIKKFGKRLSAFGESLADFAEKTSGITAESVTGAAKAGEMLIGLEQSVPREGGELQKFIGSKSLKKFGSRLISFGEDLVDFVDETKDITAESVNGAVQAGTMLATLEDTLPTTDGKFSKWFFGQKSFADFGNRLAIFGPALADFAEDVNGITEESVSGAAAAVKVLSDIENNLGTSGGVAEFWMGDNNFGQFADNLEQLGLALANFDYYTEETNLDHVASIIDVLNEIIALVDRITEGVDPEYVIKTYITRLTTAFTVNVDMQFNKIKNKAKDVINWIVMGFEEGYREYKDRLLDVGTDIGARVDEAVRERLEIASPSAVMAENGKWIVRGLAEGITNDMSAEEAAEKKASNIAAAFKTAFNNSDIFRQSLDLDYQLWEQTEGLGADDAAINAKKYEKAVEELKLYADDAAVYKAQLETSLKAFGEGSIEYIKAENTYKQALITMYQKKNEVDQLVTTSADDRRTQMQNYAAIMEENAEAFKMLGKSEDELAAFAAEKSGLTVAHPAVQQIMDENREAFAFLGKSYEELEQFALEKSGLTAQNANQQIVNTSDVIAKALAGQEVEIQASVAGAVKRGVSKGIGQGIDETDPQGEGEGIVEQLINGGKQAVENHLPEIKTATNKATSSVLDVISEVAGIASPSRVTYDDGMYIMKGLGNGIRDYTSIPVNLATKSGAQTIEGLRQGLIQKEPALMAEAQRIANQVADTMRRALQINSPSKLTQSFGNYLDEGLALGMREGIPDVENATYDVSNAMASALDETKYLINSILESDDDFAPVITPVLNLDEMKAQGRQIGRIFPRQSIDLQSARLKVGSIADQTAYGQNGSSKNGPQTNYNFTQNNYSPKALNRSEIYRQTRNQFSRLKGVTQR